MTRKTVVSVGFVALTSVMLIPMAASAQTAGIAGVVKDTTGAVLPGVTVEAASPALIEKVRSVVTDGQGQYKIVDLRPGVYTVTFTLPGFNTVRREGIELTTNFTAPVNPEMRVGALEETVTVSGQTPVVDVQSVLQRRVVDKEVISALPTARSEFNMAGLIPGMIIAGVSRPSGQDVGGSSAVAPHKLAIHGGRQADSVEMLEGIPNNTMNGWSTSGVQADSGALQEISFELGAMSAESSTGGVRTNWIPKDGGNRFTGTVFGAFTNHNLQADNLTDDLVARGLTAVNQQDKTWDANVSFGGPFKRDKLWFYFSQRSWGSYERVAGLYFDKDPLDFVYTPDLTRRALDDFWQVSETLRLTWQASARNKFTGFVNNLNRCRCHNGIRANVAPEASTKSRHAVHLLEQVSWTSPLTSRLLLEAGIQNYHFEQTGEPVEGIAPGTNSVLEQSTGMSFRAATAYTRHNDFTHNERAAVSYITGSHAFKVGFNNQHGARQQIRDVYGDYNLRLLNGVPRQVVVNATPYFDKWEKVNANLGIYVQDQWTIKRLTTNLGLRYNYFNSSVPEQHLAAVRFVPERNFAEVRDVPNWSDVMPRLGASYDLFGTGKTALKVTVSKYVDGLTVQFADLNNPINTSVNSTTRTWTDRNGDFVPQEDELGPLANAAFGKLNITTRYDDAVRSGFGARPYNWETSAAIQHELLPQVSVNAAYYRRTYGNFTVTDNLAVTPADYDHYCITAPVDPRLPGGGGNQLCGFYDLKPSKFGQVDNLVTHSKNFGKQTEVYNGVDFTMNARLPHGILLSGGLNSGTSHQLTQGTGEVTSVTDTCFVVDSPQQLQFCHVQPPWLTQVKFLGTVGLPRGFQVAGTFQSNPGPPIVATYVVPSSQISPSLGRSLSAGANATATVELVQPGTMYDERMNQVDVRLTKIFQVGRWRMQANVDLYNALNASSVLVSNVQYGPAWQAPLYILPGRLLKFSGQLDF